MRTLLPLCLVLIALTASAQAYRWVDKDGRVHYSDTPPPPGEAGKVEQKRLSPSVVEGGGALPYETRRAAENFPVVLYTAPDCAESCKLGRDFLRRTGVPFTEKSLQSEEDLADFRKAHNVREISLPMLAVGPKTLKGFEEGGWSGLLETAGYPLKPR